MKIRNALLVIGLAGAATLTPVVAEAATPISVSVIHIDPTGTRVGASVDGTRVGSAIDGTRVGSEAN